MRGVNGGWAEDPDFGRIEGAAGQWQRAALLLAHSDFQTLRHPWLCNCRNIEVILESLLLFTLHFFFFFSARIWLKRRSKAILQSLTLSFFYLYS